MSEYNFTAADVIKRLGEDRNFREQMIAFFKELLQILYAPEKES